MLYRGIKSSLVFILVIELSVHLVWVTAPLFESIYSKSIRRIRTESYLVTESAVKAVSNLFSLLGQPVNEDLVRQTVGSFTSSINVQHYNYLIAQAGRQQGILLSSFYGASAEDYNIPFIAFLKEEGYIVVKELNGKELTYINLEGKEKSISIFHFLSDYDRNIISLHPRGGRLIKRQSLVGTKEGLGVFISIYGYHVTGIDFDKVLLNKAIKKAEIESQRVKGKKWIFLMEWIGPSKEYLMQKYGISDNPKELEGALREEWSRISWSLLTAIEGRVPELYDPSHPGYSRALLEYLASKKATIHLERITYEVWNKLESDVMPHLDKAKEAFIKGDFITYSEEIYRFVTNWIEYQKKRDENFRTQIKNIMEEFPGVSIITLRGSAHYGMEEALSLEGYEVITGLTQDMDLLNDAETDDLIIILQTNNVNFPLEKTNLMILRTLPQLALEKYLRNFGTKGVQNDTILINRITRKIVNRMSEDDIKQLFQEIMAQEFVIEDEQDMKKLYQFVFKWAKENGKIKPEELVYFTMEEVFKILRENQQYAKYDFLKFRHNVYISYPIKIWIVSKSILAKLFFTVTTI